MAHRHTHGAQSQQCTPREGARYAGGALCHVAVGLSPLGEEWDLTTKAAMTIGTERMQMQVHAIITTIKKHSQLQSLQSHPSSSPEEETLELNFRERTRPREPLRSFDACTHTHTHTHRVYPIGTASPPVCAMCVRVCLACLLLDDDRHHVGGRHHHRGPFLVLLHHRPAASLSLACPRRGAARVAVERTATNGERDCGPANLLVNACMQTDTQMKYGAGGARETHRACSRNEYNCEGARTELFISPLLGSRQWRAPTGPTSCAQT